MKIEYITNSAGMVGDKYRFGLIKTASKYSRAGCGGGYIPFISWRDANGEINTVKGDWEQARPKVLKALSHMVSSHELEPALWIDFTSQIYKRFGQTKNTVLLHPDWDGINLTDKIQKSNLPGIPDWTNYGWVRQDLAKAIESGTVKITGTDCIHTAIESGTDAVCERYGVTREAARRVLGDCLTCAAEASGDY
tara:strand:+ start:147 stop:728 length:582 start_codon:yes stop_codon:yes gene_type:complete